MLKTLFAHMKRCGRQPQRADVAASSLSFKLALEMDVCNTSTKPNLRWVLLTCDFIERAQSWIAGLETTMFMGPAQDLHVPPHGHETYSTCRAYSSIIPTVD